MKTERRHELEANSLAQNLNTWSEKLRPYASALLAAIAALLVVYIVASLWRSYQATRDREAWYEFEAALFEQDLEARNLLRLTDSEDHAGTSMQEWAFMAWADRQLLRASQLYLTDRDAAKERLTAVIGIYEQIADNASTLELRNRARLGLARVNEMEGKIDDAIAQYGLVEGALTVVAEERIEQLQDKSTQETIEWLATADLPKPTPPTGPGLPGQRPGFEATPPSADPEAMNFETPQSLEEILGGAQSGDSAGRYQEEDDSAQAATPGSEESADDSDAAAPSEDSPADVSAAETSSSPEAEPADDGAEKPAEQ